MSKIQEILSLVEKLTNEDLKEEMATFKPVGPGVTWLFKVDGDEFYALRVRNGSAMSKQIRELVEITRSSEDQS